MTNPATASPWPSSPVRLICDNEMWPKMIPSGAKRNAQISDAIAMPLVGRGPGRPYGSYGGGGYAPYGGEGVVTGRQSSPMDFTWTGVAGLPSCPPPSTPAAAILSSVASPVSSIVPNAV